MNNYKKLLALALISGIVVGVISCKKDDDASPAGNGRAVIKGIVKADISDRPGKTGSERTPGVPIIAKINTKDLVANPGTGTYADMVYKVTTDADGKYTLNIDANAKAVTVSITPQDFEYQFETRNKANTADSTYRRVYSSPGSTSVTVVNGSEKIIDFNY